MKHDQVRDTKQLLSVHTQTAKHVTMLPSYLPVRNPPDILPESLKEGIGP